ncbi:hypothetical protein PRUPE_6G187900 [Prunus persica]|uniref:Uncharacterized protein n=1 Tax=Prunus persica TaxID=3760 RepID=A0A251NSI6_PRUPE|nr:hypothetical protein PRUPE_6G187900 [Prunus persica]
MMRLQNCEFLAISQIVVQGIERGPAIYNDLQSLHLIAITVQLYTTTSYNCHHDSIIHSHFKYTQSQFNCQMVALTMDTLALLIP